MLNKLFILSAAALFVSVSVCYSQFTYVSPEPDSKMHNKETGIILRTGKYIDATSLHDNLFCVNGSISGSHLITPKLAADKVSILIKPAEFFAAGETVTVKVSDGIRNSDGSSVTGTTFSFQISEYNLIRQNIASDTTINETESDENNGGLRTSCDHLPAFEITSTPGAFYDEPIFYRNWAAAPSLSDCWMISILSSAGDSIYTDNNIDVGFEFKINDNGYLTYFDKTDSSFAMLDSGYNLIKKMHMGNGYKANKHEFRIFPNGYCLMQCYDAQQLDMTPYGGEPDAQVTGLVIQEIDPNGNVIFEWRSWDHFLVTDVAPDILLTELNVDYVHGNSLELDFDGNLLLSSRNMDEITKINLANGDIIWRMGGKHNMFTFINDTDVPKPFSHQHHFTLLPNGHYTMFDNGNYQNPTRSSAKEFVLDQVNKTATLVWSYAHPAVDTYEVFGSSLGSVQVLPNGNRLIDWGQISPNSPFTDIPNFTEVDSLGNIVWEFRFVDSSYVSYRAFKHAWDRCNLVADSSLIANNISETTADLKWNSNSKISNFILQYKECSSLLWNQIPLDSNFYQLNGLQLNTCYEWRVLSICSIYADSFYTPSHQFYTLNPLSTIESSLYPTNFSVYPNPSKDVVDIKYSCKEPCNASIIVYDLPGNVLLQKEFPSQSGSNNLRINIAGLNPGIYFIKLKLNSQTAYHQLVIQ